MVISRSLCYLTLVLAAFCLLVLTHGTQPGLHGSQSSEVLSLEQVRFLLASLRERLHSTWLFLWGFLGLWLIVATWGLVERRRVGLRRPVLPWFVAVTGSVAVVALLYGLLTNGPLAHQVPVAVPLADIAGLLFVFSLPALAAHHIQAEHELTAEESFGEEEDAHLRRQSFLGLESAKTAADGSLAVGAEISAPVPASVDATYRQMEITEMTVPAHPLAVAPEAGPSHPVSTVVDVEPAPHPASASGSFREYLRLLNESWAGIESTGHEIEAWFDQQKSHALSRLAAPPGVRPEAAAPPAADFLEERLDRVDIEWERLRQVAQDLARWFEQGPRLGA
ncbi:hypothetical protein [Silvibacterium dinghuense]|uniref:Uncharacterized protein n=1 Tax=Silvibacterium dinghuense TaxID=1560006 RepID=A0A4V1NVQ8_9BACT|nr:hypothetical protein [Silvibacterium dinghuense]RXS96772.1 hypothetical protein ESZ00_02135 [Silvibacterium dinghuense]GGG93502.1 hypothetical protein GCM10011586_05330 [Silvibacterium dinghuense]